MVRCKWCNREYKLFEDDEQTKKYRCKCGAEKILFTKGRFREDFEENKED